MPNLNEMFPSKFLKAADIDQDYEVTINDVTQDTLGQGAEAETKFIVHFDEFDKGLVLNKTNANLIAAQHGNDTDAWIGKKIVLTVEDVAYQGKVQPAIRVRRPARPATPPRKAAAASTGQAQRPPQPRATSEQAASEAAADSSIPF